MTVFLHLGDNDPSMRNTDKEDARTCMWRIDAKNRESLVISRIIPRNAVLGSMLPLAR